MRSQRYRVQSGSNGPTQNHRMRRTTPAAQECISVIFPIVRDVLTDETGGAAVDYGIVILLLSITAATAFDDFGDYIDWLFSLASAD